MVILQRFAQSISLALSWKLLVLPLLNCTGCALLSMLIVHRKPLTVERAINRIIVRGPVARLEIQVPLVCRDVLTPRLARIVQETFACAMADVRAVTLDKVVDLDGNCREEGTKKVEEGRRR